MAIDSHWNDCVLLLPFDGAHGSLGIVDEKRHTIEISGSAVLSTTQAPAGCSSSLYLNGNNSYLSAISPANYDLRILFGEFSIEFPFYWLGDTVTGTANSAILIDNRVGAGFELELSVTGSTAADPKNSGVHERRVSHNFHHGDVGVVEMGNARQGMGWIGIQNSSIHRRSARGGHLYRCNCRVKQFI